MVQGFTSLGYLASQVGPDFYFFGWYFSLSLFPSCSRIERDIKSVSICPWGCCPGSHPPIVGPCLQTKCPFTWVPVCTTAARRLDSELPCGPLRGGTGTELYSSPVPTCHQLFALFVCGTSLLFVRFGSLPFQALLEVSPLPHLTSVSSCPASVPQTGALFLFPTPTQINSPLQLWIMPTGPFPLSPYSKFQFVIHQHAILTKEAYLSLSH